MKFATITLIHSLLLTLGLVASGFSEMVDASDAELLWIASEHEQHIMLSQLESNAWSQPVSVYHTENSITSPAMVTDLNGKTVLIWTERFKTRAVLMKMRRQSPTQDWSKAELFSDFGKENYAATMVVDWLNDIWLFWSANHGELDDVYLVKRTQGGWSKPLRVNDENAVPDVNPQCKLDQQGNIYLEWQSYSFEEGDYLTLFKVFDIDKSAHIRYKAEQNKVEEMTADELTMPSFLPNNAVVLVHFSSNRLLQSARIDTD